MQFRQINIKTGKELPLLPKIVENTYLEQKFGSEIDSSKLAIGRMYDGITERDIENLKEQGLHIILASGRTAYFADREIASKVSQEIFSNHSDAVAYGSLPVSDAKTSVFKERSRILIIDDETLTQAPETGKYAADCGKEPITLSNGITLSDKAMGAIASKLGDCYSLISTDLATQLEAEPNRPFQFRAGVPEWEGIFKGTCRSSVLCQALEVDAIVAKSSIKGDGKTTTTGIHEVDLFWSRKEDARFTEQKLGTQALVFFPDGVKADVLPKLKAKAESLAEAQSDPRKIAQLYIERHEKRLQKSQEPEEEDIKQLIEPELAKELGLENLEAIANNQQSPQTEKEYKDWLYEILKADLIDGGHCQMLEMEDITKRLQEFMQSEWVDVATGGVYVPSGIAQPHNQLQEGEVSFKGLPDGAKVGIYRSPVANAANFDVFTNNLKALRENDPEAYMQKGICYMNPSDAKRLVIDFDGDRVGIIPSELTPEQQAQSKKEIEQYPTLIAEIVDKNLPENKPVQVEKEKKIPRDKEHGFPNLASAAVNAADNPTGKVANLGMRLEALRWDIQNIPSEDKSNYLQNIGNRFQRVLAEDRDDKKKFSIPNGDWRERVQKVLANTRDGKPKSKIINDDWRERITEISQIASQVPQMPETERPSAIDMGLAKTERLLWDLESLTAVNLQRAVDTPKSARKVDEREFDFCQKIGKYKEVEWIKDKDNTFAYMGSQGMKTNTQDPVGWMVEQANQIHHEYKLIGDRNYNRFDHLLPKDSHSNEQAKWAKDIATEYGDRIAKAVASRNRLEHEEEIAITATSSKGNVIEIVSPSQADPEGKSPIWDMAKNGETIDIQIDQNKDWKTKSSYPYKAVAIIDAETKVDIGLISPETIKAHGNALQVGRVLPNLKLDFNLGISRNDIKDLFAAAEQYLEAQSAAIPEPERESRAAALWHNNNRAIAGKMFTEIVTSQLQELQIDKVKVIGLQYESNELKDKQWQPNQSINCRMALESNPDSPIFDKRVIQVFESDRWKNMGVLHNDAAYMPIGTQFEANISLSASKKDADLAIAPRTMKSPEVWHGLSPERVKEAVNLDAIAPKLKEAIAKAAENKPTMTEFVAKLADENVGLKAQIQQGGRINGLTYLYEGQAVKASLIEMSWKNIAAMGVKYDPGRDLEALTNTKQPIITQSESTTQAIIQTASISPRENQQQASVKQNETPLKITGKPVQMVYPLKMHGETNPLPVDSCIEAMRGYGRCHTTRRFEPYAAYNFKEGDIAIAYAGEKQVAFQVGKQYQISREMLTDAEYQQQWTSMEKHGAKELLTFQGHTNTWGLHFEPLGDYIDGKIVPFPSRQHESNSIVIDVESLEEWRQTAQYLRKSENYVNRIQEIIEGESISEKASLAMTRDFEALGKHVASQWREILVVNSDYVEKQDGKLVFERKGKEGKYKATWEQSTDTLTLEAKEIKNGTIKYSPLLVQKGLDITKNLVTVRDAQKVDRALTFIAKNQKERQEQR
jgi:hypothetical protein